MSYLDDKVVLVTGSFGKKFVATILKEYKPEKVIVYSHDELKQHEMRQIIAPFENRRPHD